MTQENIKFTLKNKGGNLKETKHYSQNKSYRQIFFKKILKLVSNNFPKLVYKIKKKKKRHVYIWKGFKFLRTKWAIKRVHN